MMLTLALIVGVQAGLKDTKVYTDESDRAVSMKEEEDSPNPKTAAMMAVIKSDAVLDTGNKATRFNKKLQTQAQLDVGMLRISPVGEILGHPSDAMIDANLITSKAQCEAAYTIRHRMDADPSAY